MTRPKHLPYDLPRQIQFRSVCCVTLEAIALDGSPTLNSDDRGRQINRTAAAQASFAKSVIYKI
jgi:hypothetical protein